MPCSSDFLFSGSDHDIIKPVAFYTSIIVTKTNAQCVTLRVPGLSSSTTQYAGGALQTVTSVADITGAVNACIVSFTVSLDPHALEDVLAVATADESPPLLANGNDPSTVAQDEPLHVNFDSKRLHTRWIGLHVLAS